METIDAMQALNVFEKIQQYGHVDSDGKVLDGVHASASFDGYTVTMWDDYVTMNIQFHNTCKFDLVDKRYQEAFLDKLAFIDKAYKNGMEENSEN